MNQRPRFVGLILFLSLGWGGPILGGEVPSPKDELGYIPGADYRLVGWKTVVEYFKKVDGASPRVVVRELGPTTEGRPYLAAIISSAETIAVLDSHRDRQQQVADPRKVSDAKEGERLIAETKPVVLITCSIHSDETASTFMAMELLHNLATDDDPATKEILDNTILILVPSANPDGVDKVAAWYEKTKGHPWEGSGMPELYHVVAGHDTNRDWFMLNLRETKLLTRLLYHEWFPTITYDVHQMGSRGARMFVPPFFDPINPNLDPRLSQSIFLLGAHMAIDLASAGKRGVLTHAMYDNWWNGGNRTTPQRHNMVGVLTEAASVRLATPIFLEQSELRGATRGFANHKPSVNFVDPWPGGWWRLRDIVDYELICAKSVLTLAARYRVQFQRNYAAMARDSIEKGKSEPPYGWVVPPDQRDPASATLMLKTLAATGIEIHRSKEGLKIGGQEFPAGSWILPASQPFRPHLKDMMERQAYPTRFGPDGNAEPPYDVAGWTLPLQMGVKVVPLTQALPLNDQPVASVELRKGQLADAAPDAAKSPKHWYQWPIRSADDLRLVNGLHAAGIALTYGVRAASMDREEALIVELPASEEARRAIESSRSRGVATVATVGDLENLRTPKPFKARKVGLYHPWVPSMDEGWTRFVLEEFGFKPDRLDQASLRAGRLKERIDVLVIPSIKPGVLKEGFGPEQSAPEYVGGLNGDCVKSLRSFLKEGGTIVCLEDSCDFAIEEFGLPVTNILKGLKGSEFYCPGSILRGEVVRGTTKEAEMARYTETSGMPGEFSLYFDRSLAFTTSGNDVETHVRYARVNPLESGWLLGAEKIAGKAALVSAKVDGGRVVLFGFPPQHRGQTHGTFLLLFNAILRD